MKNTITLISGNFLLMMIVCLSNCGCDRGKGEVDQFLQSQPGNVERPGSFATPLAPGVSTEASLLTDQVWAIELLRKPR